MDGDAARGHAELELKSGSAFNLPAGLEIELYRKKKIEIRRARILCSLV